MGNPDDSETEILGAELVLSAPGNKHVGTLIQTSPTAPDGIEYQSLGMPCPLPWRIFIDDDGLFRVMVPDWASLQYVCDDAQALKSHLNEIAADPAVMRETHDLKYWSGH